MYSILTLEQIAYLKRVALIVILYHVLVNLNVTKILVLVILKAMKGILTL